MNITREAYCKIFAMTKHKTEVAAMCITPNDPTLIEDIYVLKQKAAACSFELEEEDVYEAIEDLIGQGFELWQFNRILVHTHPGNSNTPSTTDWDNFNTYYKHQDFSAMIIMGKDGKMSCNVSAKVEAINGHVQFEDEVIVWDQLKEDAEAEIRDLIKERVSDKLRKITSNAYYPNLNKTELMLFNENYDGFAGYSLEGATDETSIEERLAYFDAYLPAITKESKALEKKLNKLLEKEEVDTIITAINSSVDDNPHFDAALLKLMKHWIIAFDMQADFGVERMKKELGSAK